MPQNKIQETFHHFYQQGNQSTGGAFQIIWRAVRQFNELRGAEAAASIAYYALFSLFPLLLALVSILGVLLVNVQAPEQVLRFITEIIPISQQLIEDNLLAILEARGTIGLIGLAGVLWAASGVFITLARNINLAWPESSLRNLFQSRLLALIMIGLLSLLLITSVIISTLFNLLPRLEIPIQGSVSIYDTAVWRTLSVIIPWLIAFFVFVSLYRWMPTVKVLWREALWGALAATIAWEITARAFTWYLGTPFARFEQLYGSLATIIVLMTYIYISAIIILFGAHLSSSIAQADRLKGKSPTDRYITE